MRQQYNRDSPRWCAWCQQYGDHHTDRHPNAQALAEINETAERSSAARRKVKPLIRKTTFTCWCGLKTHDLTRPCPHWWGLLWGWLR